MSTRPRATIDNLYQVPDNGKAEIVNGELVVMEPTGFLPSRAAAAIFESLREYERRTGRGFAIPDNAGFVVDLPHRSSFSPDAAFYVGEPSGMKFLQRSPDFRRRSPERERLRPGGGEADRAQASRLFRGWNPRCLGRRSAQRTSDSRLHC